jgi:hypothetical protein
MVLDMMMSSGLFYPVLVGVSAIIGIVGFKIFIDYKNSGKEMEEEALAEVIRGEIKEMTDMFGYEVKKNVTYGMYEIGRIEKAYYTEEIPADKIDQVNMDEEEEEEEEEDSEEFKKYYYFKIRPTEFSKRVVAKLTDDTMASEKYTNYIRVSDEYIQDGDRVSISHNWNPKQMAGVWIQEREAPHYIRDRTYQSILEKSLETAKETVRAINELNLAYVEQEMQMEKLQELKGGDLQEQMEKFMEGK